MPAHSTPLYEDSSVLCDANGIHIKRYYFPWGTKFLPYQRIESVTLFPLTGINRIRRFRIWGSGDLLHWWNLDVNRFSKQSAIVLRTGRHIRPSFTPNDPDAVLQLIKVRIN